MKNLQIRMVCRDVSRTPRHAVPAPYSLRWYEPGDEDAWVGIQARSDRYNTVDAAAFEREFGEHRQDLPHRMCFLLDAGRTPVGTATAWYNNRPSGEPEWGRVHWVAVVPEHQGRGLSKPLLSAVCRRFSELGTSVVCLTTATVRIPAINLYCQFGFAPAVTDDADAKAWRCLLDEAPPRGRGLSPRAVRAISRACDGVVAGS